MPRETTLPWTAYTPAEKRRARRLAKQGRARITEEHHAYIGAKKLVSTVALYVEPICAEGGAANRIARRENKMQKTHAEKAWVPSSMDLDAAIAAIKTATAAAKEGDAAARRFMDHLSRLDYATRDAEQMREEANHRLRDIHDQQERVLLAMIREYPQPQTAKE